jgi:transcriptional regulator with GAF, ATPase, and Fis domain
MHGHLNTDAFPSFGRQVGILFDVMRSDGPDRTVHAAPRHLPSQGPNLRLVTPHSTRRPDTEIIGQSAALRQVLRDVEQVAETDATVLVLGETGTGKELIAKALHESSARRDKPLVKLNCTALPASLIESELFGHERGAFTGATRKREGRFAMAHGGTLFLDEIGELPADLQAKLLRVLQEGEFEPVGSSQTRKVDVRIVAATHRDLRAAVQEGRFREDLFYRLNVFPIHLPALRERVEDIPLLVEAFAERFAKRLGRVIAPASPECIRRLQAYRWPGNVRELQNVVERAVIASRTGLLEADRCLPEPVQPASPAAAGETGYDAPVLTIDQLRQLERDNIVRALGQCGWRISGESGAARLLNMNPSTLTSRIKALEIKRAA